MCGLRTVAHSGQSFEHDASVRVEPSDGVRQARCQPHQSVASVIDDRPRREVSDQQLRVDRLDQGDSELHLRGMYLRYTERGSIMTRQSPFETFQHRDNCVSDLSHENIDRSGEHLYKLCQTCACYTTIDDSIAYVMLQYYRRGFYEALQLECTTPIWRGLQSENFDYSVCHQPTTSCMLLEKSELRYQYWVVCFGSDNAAKRKSVFL
ncbi:hypothetical protein C8R48DRAFT_766015 [Suillus tomentosus]|nr:hypothetical protein C8R48DRAFT_766015 [Suillus tomentosus]